MSRKKAKHLNYVAEKILALLEAKYDPRYVAEKRAELMSLSVAQTLDWAQRKLDASNLADLAASLGIDVENIANAGRILRFDQ